MSMQEARERGLIRDAEDGPFLDVEYEEAPEPLDEYDEDGRPAKRMPRVDGHHAGKGWQADDLDDLRRRGLIPD